MLLKSFAGYFWPREWDLRARVVLSLAFLLGAKVLNVQVSKINKRMNRRILKDSIIERGREEERKRARKRENREK